MWKDAPREYGPPKTLYNRWKRWSWMGVFATIMTELVAEAQDTATMMIDATHLKAHRTASSLAVEKSARGRLIGRTKGGLNSKLHVLADAEGRPIRMFLSAGQNSDCIGARALLSSIPQAETLLADRGYDAHWFRNALSERGILPCIPSRIGRKTAIRITPRTTASATELRTCSPQSRTSGESHPAATDAPTCSSQPEPLAAVVLFWL